MSRTKGQRSNSQTTLTKMVVAYYVATFRQPERDLGYSKVGIKRQMTDCTADELPEVEFWLYSLLE